MATITEVGYSHLYKIMLGISSYEQMDLELYTNDAGDLAVATYDDLEICSLPGYAPQTLDPDDWEDLTMRGKGDFINEVKTWTFTTSDLGQDLYGWAVIAKPSYDLLWLQAISPVINIPPTGGRYAQIPEWISSQCS